MFVYRIGLTKRTSEDRDYEFMFDAHLLEDLYLKSRDGENWTLCECLCETRNCFFGDVQMIEPVKGISLNNLFSNMVAYYFPLQRSGSCSAFDYFYFSHSLSHDLYELKNGQLRSLDSVRKEIIKSRKR
jgi:hypothetical protein